MAVDNGLSITFLGGLESGEELPPVGVLDNLVVRPQGIVADRKTIAQAGHVGADVARWLEAELEFQRATGVESSGARRTSLRVAAPDGVFLRFGSFGDPRQSVDVPELGPFSAVHVRPDSLEADGVIVAIRGASDLAAWQLTAAAGAAAAGIRRPDVAFRTIGTSFHPAVVGAPVSSSASPPQTVIAERSASTPQPDFLDRSFSTSQLVIPEPEPRTPKSPAVEQPALTERDLELIRRVERGQEDEMIQARSRVLEQERRAVVAAPEQDQVSLWSVRGRIAGADVISAPPVEEPSAPEFEWRTLLWRLRFVIVAALAIGILALGLSALHTGLASLGQARTVAIDEQFSASGWDFTVNSVVRTPTAGQAVARGVWVVLIVSATNHGADGALQPARFELVDAVGTRYAPEPPQSSVYKTSGGPYLWPPIFQSGRPTSFSLVFDVSSGASGLRLVIEGTSARVRLE